MIQGLTWPTSSPSIRAPRGVSGSNPRITVDFPEPSCPVMISSRNGQVVTLANGGSVALTRARYRTTIDKLGKALASPWTPVGSSVPTQHHPVPPLTDRGRSRHRGKCVRVYLEVFEGYDHAGVILIAPDPRLGRRRFRTSARLIQSSRNRVRVDTEAVLSYFKSIRRMSSAGLREHRVGYRPCLPLWSELFD
jgi:hypothetical protein